MEALVLEEKGKLCLRDFQIDETLGTHDVRIDIKTVGLCGSDVHYYEFGRIGNFIVNCPMILGHEAAGVVTEVGANVTHLKIGDRVCMEPGIPSADSRAVMEGHYNLDPAVRFWATPPIHGVLRPSVVHPAAFTFKLPDNISFAEGAMVEPLAVGMHAAVKAKITPGDIAVVIGAGPIGTLTALAVLAGGCSQIIIADVQQPKLEIAAGLGPITPINVKSENLLEAVKSATDGWGADIVFECSGNVKAAAGVFDLICPAGCVVMVGMPAEPVMWDVVASQVKEARIENVFRYANVYNRAVALMASGKLNVKPLITDTFDFRDSVKAFDYALHLPATSVKAQIKIAD